MNKSSPAIEKKLSRWYLLQCKANQDSRAEENLKRQGYNCYRPTRRAEHIRQGTRKTITESLFPGYIFINLDRSNDNWHPIRSTKGVSRIVTFGNTPAWLEDKWVDQIRALESMNVVHPIFKQGEKVIVSAPGFENTKAVFLSNDGEERVIILLSILRRQQPMSVSISSIRKIN